MKVTYDKGSDAIYIKFDEGGDKALEYDHVDGEWPINVNVAEGGTVMGIEIMDASNVLSKRFLEQALQGPKTKVQKYLDRKKGLQLP